MIDVIKIQHVGTVLVSLKIIIKINPFIALLYKGSLKKFFDRFLGEFSHPCGYPSSFDKLVKKKTNNKNN